MLNRIVAVAICAALMGTASAQNWGSFRGSGASGMADGQDPPISWDATRDSGPFWKTSIPGLGHSSPVVWANRIFVTTAISGDSQSQFVHGLTETAATASDTSKHSFRVYCLDKESGRIIWERTACDVVPKVKRHVKASHANSTPATDGSRVVVLFGSEGIYCYDFDGKLIWKQDPGKLDGGWSADPNAQWGFGSSPIIYKGLVIIQCDIQTGSFIAAYNIKDGGQVWRVSRSEDTSWSTPTIHEGKTGAELVTSGTKHYRGYDPLTGKELWRLADGVDVKIPTPIAAFGLYFLGGGSSAARRTFYAVRAGQTGEIKLPENAPGEGVAWQSPVIKPHVVTPIVYGDYLYVCTDNGILTQYNARTGDPGYRARLGQGGAFSASPVAADGRIYFASEDGDVFVVKAGTQFELLARNPIGEVVFATPAITQRMIVVRG
ncbi:MAG TPA: PQQ-binding-like beta-propeller repeat protein, partial [Blastocatellia bacterium]|nr:PQQ-binding-like beta-propeller repeat protein [Blastocatellia bacterium]